MKVLSFIVVLSLGLFLNAQDRIEKTVGEFSKLKVYDLIQLKMIKSNEDKIVITGKNKDDVQVVNKNGKLKIRMQLRQIFDGNKTEVILYYTSVHLIDANEGAKVTVETVIEQNDLELKTQEGAVITANFKGNYAKFRAVTGGVITIEGSSKNQDISIYTGGVFNGENFSTSHTEVRINAAGVAHINASEKASVKIKAGGDVYIHGNPKTLDQSRVFGGRIIKI